MPGARRLRKLALFEKLEIVLCLVVEPTLIAKEIQAGWLSAAVLPSLPAATTVAMSAARRLPMIEVSAGDTSSQVALKRSPHA